ncbi:rRNA maturation RNase YbeY [Paenibacillus gallinarum]|uniref:Endoribonuclease YbeY n=1 Tax=Paenibacillus gallinarum TaxID=2762232 RepID=A0ABR8SVT5_9BACL|nr:rRNA maturation RNase YbeY [Paenibacillus gallinarum]MBD7967595.1 rRNA maturation RNase YbeY [Paenibacillus gallinarum]
MSVQLVWNNNQEVVEITEELIGTLERLLEKAAEMEKITDGEVALTFVTDQEIHELNKEYRGIDRPTDVLSFAMNESIDEELDIIYDLGENEAIDLPEILGDIIISVETAIAQSKEYGHSIDREIGFLFVHGFLHLLGYDHQDEASEAEMMGKQETVLAEVGLSR